MKRSNDIYAPQIAALMALAPDEALSATKMAAAISDRLRKWDREKHGDWEDVLAITARREALHIRDPYALLAAVLLRLESRRAAEIGKILRKFEGRSASGIIRGVKKAGGLKTASRLEFEPPPLKKPRIRRKRPTS